MRVDRWVMAAALVMSMALPASALTTVKCDPSDGGSQTYVNGDAGGGFDKNTTRYDLAATTGSVLGGAGCFAGNETNPNKSGPDKVITGIIDTTVLFGTDGWTLGGKFDVLPDDTDASSGDGSIVVTIGGVSTATPTWSLNLGGNTFERLMIALKQDGNYAVFELSGSDNILAGTWGTLGPGGSVNALSHASAWYIGKTPGGGDPPGTIPLPAAGWLLISVVAGIGVARRRMQRAS